MPAGGHASVSANHARQSDARSSAPEDFDGAGGLIGRIYHAHANVSHGNGEESEADRWHHQNTLGELQVKALCPPGERIKTGFMELMMFYAAKSTSGHSSTVRHPCLCGPTCCPLSQSCHCRMLLGFNDTRCCQETCWLLYTTQMTIALSITSRLLRSRRFVIRWLSLGLARLGSLPEISMHHARVSFVL